MKKECQSFLLLLLLLSLHYSYLIDNREIYSQSKIKTVLRQGINVSIDHHKSNLYPENNNKNTITKLRNNHHFQQLKDQSLL